MTLFGTIFGLVLEVLEQELCIVSDCHVNQNISWVLGMLMQVLRISYRMKYAIILLAKLFLSFGKCGMLNLKRM